MKWLAIVLALVCAVPTIAQAEEGDLILVPLKDPTKSSELAVEMSISLLDREAWGQMPDSRVKVHHLPNRPLSVRHLLNSIEAIPADSDDAVLLLYAGHGYINQQRQPYIKLNGDGKPVLIKEILRRLKKTKARKTVALFECCQAIGNDSYWAPAPNSPREPSKLFKALFFDQPADIPVCIISSSAGEYAIGAHLEPSFDDPNQLQVVNGGIFSYEMAGALHRHRNEALSWKEILAEVKTKTGQHYAKLKARRDVVLLSGNAINDLKQKSQTPQLYVPIELKRP
ncbi:caspase family protein [Stratiformator vulcanicus]|uniref:Caspase domain protein n=1 Tax=Stratiformator vulcanicus TaxID=2527980 RepID=A0A517QW40_9PLAN|nr:caspase family protein [Stratiformator vulcanicus]QDT35879.1 Caspase domain protein [Stratiformator vulcanicus]